MTNLKKALKYLEMLSDKHEYGPDRWDTLDTLEGAERELKKIQVMLHRYGGDDK